MAERCFSTCCWSLREWPLLRCMYMLERLPDARSRSAPPPSRVASCRCLTPSMPVRCTCPAAPWSCMQGIMMPPAVRTSERL